MTEVVSIKFNCRGKKYFFDPNGVDVKEGDTVIVETAKGLDVGKAVIGNHPVPDESLIPPLRPVIRIATDDDYRIIALNKEREVEASAICKEKITQHGLEMKLVDVECSFEGNKILFFFTADGRVDFRELVKDLASVFHTRIELRQIGVRDETKMLGGIGICGRPFCCNTFLSDFQPVSTKMAKTQSISLNPAKISGCCGRLMCCLRYEQEAYEDLVKTIPKNGAFVQTIEGYGNVVQTNILRQNVKVKIDGNGMQEIKQFDLDQIAVIPGGRPKPGEPLPDILEYVEKPKEKQDAEEDSWLAPSLFAFDNDQSQKPKEKRNNQHNRRPNNNNKSKQGGGNNKPKLKNTKSNEQSGNPNENNQGKSTNRDGNNQQQKGGAPNQKSGNNPNRRRRNKNKPRPQKPQGDASNQQNQQSGAPKKQNQQNQQSGAPKKQNQPKQHRSKNSAPNPANPPKSKE